MKRTILLFSAAFIFLTGLQSCKDENRDSRSLDNDATEKVMGDRETKELEDTDVVASGTYTGTARIVDREQNEIYLDLDDNRTLELYTSNDTQFMRNGEQVDFDALQQGQRLEVEVEREGESLKPKMVRILHSQ
ncbi:MULTISPECIES: hypothetical protein [Antarcticibacterium]|nr:MULTISPECIES: hypothetical protein [Antarcticibacterium]